LIRYAGKFDKRFENFLVKQAINNKYLSMEKFSEDSNYAFDCILLEFYKLWPI